MNKISVLLIFLTISFFTISCEEENVTTYSINQNPIEVQHLKIIPPVIIKNNYTTATLPNTGRTEVNGKKVNYDFLEFEREVDFWAATGQNHREDYMKDWHNKYQNFFSLEEEINYIFSKYDALLNQVERQFSDISQITPDIESKIDNEISNLLQPYYSIVFYSKEEGIQRKTFSPTIDYALNRDGIVKIEGKIYQYKNEVLKMILDGDVKKISLLDNILETDKNLNIYVFPVQQASKNDGGRVEGFTSLSSCSNRNGGFKLIAYEEESIFFNDWNHTAFIDYRIQLRSLRKRFRWWGNRSTKQHHSEGNYTANFVLGTSPNTSYSTPPLQAEAHTYIYTLHQGYVDAQSELDAQQQGKVFNSSHTASGAHSTSCTFGFY